MRPDLAQQRVSARSEQARTQPEPECGRIFGPSPHAVPEDPLTVHAGYQAMQDDRVLFDRCVARDRYPAVPVQTRQQTPFRFDRYPRVLMVQRGDQSECFRIVRAADDGERTLADRRKHDIRLEMLRDARSVTQSPETGGREQDGFELPVVEFLEPRADIPADRARLQMREPLPELCRPAQTAGTDAGARRHLIQRSNRRDDRVPRIFPLGDRSNDSAGSYFERKVLHAVDRQVDPAVKKRLVEFLGKEALSPNFGQRRIKYPVTGGLDRYDVHNDITAR